MAIYLEPLTERRQDGVRRWSVGLIPTRVRQRQPAVTAHDEVAAALERVVLDVNRLALQAPAHILDEDAWTIHAPDRVAPQAVRVIHDTRRISQEARACVRLSWRGEALVDVARCKERSGEKRDPVAQSFQLREREYEKRRFQLGKLPQYVRLMQLHQMLVAVESGQVPEEDERDRLGELAEMDFSPVCGGQPEIGSDRSHLG